MKRIILLFSLLAAALSVQAQTTGTWNKVVARDTLVLSGRQLAEVVYSILATSKNNEVPTAKAVYNYVHEINNRGDSAWVKTSGLYPNKRITDNIYKNGTLGVRTNDTTGVLNVKTRTGKTGEVITMDTTGEGTVYLSLKPPAFDNVPQLQPFNFMTRRYQGVNSPYNPSPNFVWRFGYNQNTDGSRISTSAPAGGIDFEYLYHNASLPKVTEFHIYNIDSLGNTLKFITAAHNWNAARGGARLGFQSDLLTFNDKLSSAVWAHNPLTNIWTFADTVGFTFAEPRGFSMSVQNGANSAAINLMDFNSTDTLEMLRQNGVGLKLHQPLILNLGQMYSGQSTDIKIGSATRETDLSLFGDFRLVKSASNNAITMLHTGDLQTWATNSITHGFVRNDGFMFFKNFGSNDLTTFNLTQVSDAFGSPGLNLNSTSTIKWSNSANWYGTKDIGLARSSAGVLDVTNGSSSLAKLRAAQLRVTTDDGTSTTIWGADGDGDFSKITVSTGLNLSGNVLTATGTGTVTGTGASPRIAYWSGTSSLTSDADLQWDGTKIAITGIPAGQTDGISITNTNAGTNDQTQFRLWNDSGTTANDGGYFGLASSGRSSPYANAMFFWLAENGPIAFGQNNAERMRVTGNGLIIGSTANAANRLDVEGGAVIGATYSGTSAASTNGLLVEGNVGIGNTSAQRKLHVTTVTGTTTPILRIENTGGSADFFVANTSPEGSITASPGSLALRTDTGNGKLYVKGSGTGNTGWLELGAGGATDHGALTGLSDDDHSQYLLLAGRATGQIATGGTASGDDLTLRSTTDATKGDVILNDQGGNVILGGGELSGELRFMEPGGSGSNYTGFKSGAMGANQMYTLPTDAPSDGDVMTWGTGNVLSWEPVGGAANYQTWREDGAAATVQPNANFVTSNTIEPTLTNDAGNSETEVSLEIVGNSVNSSHLSQMGAAAGQVLTWDGAAWNPAYVTDDIYPADITVDVNDYEPTGWATSTEVFVSSSAIWTITGFDALVGQVRTVINDGDFPFVIACHHTGSTAGNRVFGREDLIVLPGDAVTLTYNNNIGRWYVKSNTFYPQKLGTVWNGIYYYQQPGSTNQSDHSFLGLATSGTGTSNANAVPDAEQPNHWEASTGSTAAGIATIYLPKNANNFARTGDGHIEVQANVFVPTLSTSAQRYTLQVGMIPNANTTTLAVNNSVVVRYKDDVNDGEFELVTRNNAGTETAVDCNVAVAANTPYQITVVLNESRTEARAYINGTLAAINTSTMPNAAVNVGARVGIFKSVGTTARFAKIGSIVGFVVL